MLLIRHFQHLAAAAVLMALLVPGARGAVSTVVLEDFEGGATHGAAAVTASNSSGQASNSTAQNVTDSGSKRLRMADPDGGYNGLVLQFSAAFSAPGKYLVTADVKVDNAAAQIDSFGMAARVGDPSTAEISDTNAGYVMNLPQYKTTATTLGYQTIGAAIDVDASGSFPKNLTLYFSTDPSGNSYNAPANDGNFSGGHRSLATAWASASDAVYVDNIKLIGPGNPEGEDRHLWISLGDGFTNLASLENYLVQAKANNFNCVDILARYRANHYYRKTATLPPTPTTSPTPRAPATPTTRSSTPSTAATNSASGSTPPSAASWSPTAATATPARFPPAARPTSTTAPAPSTPRQPPTAPRESGPTWDAPTCAPTPSTSSRTSCKTTTSTA